MQSSEDGSAFGSPWFIPISRLNRQKLRGRKRPPMEESRYGDHQGNGDDVNGEINKRHRKGMKELQDKRSEGRGPYAAKQRHRHRIDWPCPG
jgi:hypothetical protein